MPSSFLILCSLVAGYSFIHVYHRLRFRAQALSGYRLIIEASCAGLIALVFSRLACVGIHPLVPTFLLRAWSRLVNGVPFVGSTILAILFAILAAASFNLIQGFFHRGDIASDRKLPWGLRHVMRFWTASRDHSLNTAIEKSGNGLQKLLHAAATSALVDGSAVGLTMSNSKFYVGFVTTSPSLSDADEYVSLFPLMSGHREPETQKVVYDFVYPIDTITELAEDREVVMVVPIAEIRSAHVLDADYLVTEMDRLGLERSRANAEPE